MKNNISKFAVLACVACFALSSQSEAAPHGAPGFGKPAPHGVHAPKPGDRHDAKHMHNAAMEKARLEKERLEKARMEKERLEKARLEKERLEKARLEKERLVKARLEKERLEKARMEKERAVKPVGRGSALLVINNPAPSVKVPAVKAPAPSVKVPVHGHDMKHDRKLPMPGRR